MINVENEIYTIVATALREQFPGVFVSGEYVTAPASFPAVTLIESDNYVDVSMSTLNIENAVNVMYLALLESAERKCQTLRMQLSTALKAATKPLSAQADKTIHTSSIKIHKEIRP